jgi:hypothetical protein
MKDYQESPLAPEQKQRLLVVFEKLLPVVDSLADKLRLILILGVLVTAWLVIWLFFLKHFSLGITAITGIVALLPTLILGRFWWALEELKNLPDIAGQMMGDAKNELQESVQNIRAGKAPKLGFFSAGRSLWSVGAMVSEARDLLGSYLSITTLVNPFMLVLGVLSLLIIFMMCMVSLILAFFV